MKQYLGCSILILKILAIRSLTSGCLLPEKGQTGSWYATITDLKLQIVLHSNPLQNNAVKNPETGFGLQQRGSQARSIAPATPLSPGQFLMNNCAFSSWIWEKRENLLQQVFFLQLFIILPVMFWFPSEITFVSLDLAISILLFGNDIGSWNSFVVVLSIMAALAMLKFLKLLL